MPVNASLSSLSLACKHAIKLKNGQEVFCFSLKKLAQSSKKSVMRLPYSIRVLLENQLRNIDQYKVFEEDVGKVLDWDAKNPDRPEIPHMPARVVMQDFTGVPAVVDLAAMRDAIKAQGGDPAKINPLVDTALVVDHSVQVDFFGQADSLGRNVAVEYERNSERYKLLKWAQSAFDDFKVVPPGMGIIHQVNLEYLAQVVMQKNKQKNNQEDHKGEIIAYPDSLVGTDSHTTMINGLGVMGWGVGGIEAEAVMLGQPYYMLLPDVVGFKLLGQLREGVTGTDLVLRITEMLRKVGVVGKFVEFFGSGLDHLPLPDRATIANMAPEYGATMGFFPVDKETCRYLRQSNRQEAAELCEAVLPELLLFREDSSEEPEYSSVIELDLSTVDSTLAGPKRPQDRVPLRELKSVFNQSLTHESGLKGYGLKPEELNKKIKISGEGFGERSSGNSEIGHGSVVIAAITSCTNTSNPYVMIGAGLLARNAVKKGLKVKPYVKTSLAPGSQVVTEYLKQAGVLGDLEKLHFNVVGYGCTTCIGNSGALPDSVAKAVKEGDLVAAAVLSGNRNFEGRVHPQVKANFLASPIHVVAFALVGTVDFDPEVDAVGLDLSGNPVFLKDIWPSTAEIAKTVDSVVTSEMFKEKYDTIFDGTEDWQKLVAPMGKAYEWDNASTYIQCPPFFANFATQNGVKDVLNARVLLLLGDSITTDHISPAGSIALDYPAGKYLIERGVLPKDFNSYGARRGSHDVMMRGTFANIRIRNLLLPGTEGAFTVYHPTGEKMFTYDAAMKYQSEDIPLVVIGGKEYGTGSSRDWAAKGTMLLGVKVVIAESYERIHRSNLVGMGVLPLQFLPGESAKSLGLDGTESFDFKNLSNLKAKTHMHVDAVKLDGSLIRFKVQVRLDALIEEDYFKNGGILQTVLLNLMKN
jgi:aconitate hydratase